MREFELREALTDEQEAEVKRIYDRLEQVFDEERMRMARQLASMVQAPAAWKQAPASMRRHY